jgi:hypothetical protein
MSDKIRNAIFNAIRERTEAFNKATFPQAADDWTPEQQAIWEFINGESGGLARMHESDQPEIAKNLARIAGLEGIESRFAMKQTIKLPPYIAVVLRESVDSYPSGFPLITGRISGCWTEEGSGSSRLLCPQARKMRPTTPDDINALKKAFPKGKLDKLYGAIHFSDETGLRAALTENIINQTKKFASTLEGKYPEGISEKGKAILKMGKIVNADLLAAFAIILEDPHITEPYKAAPLMAEFLPYCAIVHKEDRNGSCYTIGRVHVNADIVPTDVFFTYEDEGTGEPIGNHMGAYADCFRPATDEEIGDYVTNLKSEKLYLYASSLNEEQVISLL